MNNRKDLDLEHFKELLLEEKKKLEDELNGIEKDAQALDEAASEAEDRGDIAEIDYQNEVDRDQIKRIKAEIAEVEHALDKIKDGTYGICEKTGKAIPVERLEAYPAARTVVDA